MSSSEVKNINDRLLRMYNRGVRSYNAVPKKVSACCAARSYEEALLSLMKDMDILIDDIKAGTN